MTRHLSAHLEGVTSHPNTRGSHIALDITGYKLKTANPLNWTSKDKVNMLVKIGMLCKCGLCSYLKSLSR